MTKEQAFFELINILSYLGVILMILMLIEIIITMLKAWVLSHKRSRIVRVQVRERGGKKQYRVTVRGRGVTKWTVL